MDFTLNTYKRLINSLLNHNYLMLPFKDFLNDTSERAVCLRHDADADPERSLRISGVLSDYGIRGTFYFRAVSGSWDENIIRMIAQGGHEIGYHYEDMCSSWVEIKKEAGSMAREENNEKMIAEKSIGSFVKNLEKIREVVPVSTICMHGSPLSRWDSRLLWKYYDYRDFGITGEPYFDIDAATTLYLTDTGRRWNGEKMAVRDKPGKTSEENKDFRGWKIHPARNSLMNMTEESQELQERYNFRSSFQIIEAVENEEFQGRALMVFHPQRWTEDIIAWSRELIWQNIKNMAKYIMVSTRD